MVRRTGVLLWTALLACWLLALTAAAQTAPTWQQAFSGNNVQPTSFQTTSDIIATTADGAGNIYVAGILYGAATFGSIQMPQSQTGMFVAKWSTTTNTWLWVTRGGTTSVWPTAIAVNGGNVYVTGYFQGGTTTIAGTTLTANTTAFFVAKFIDNGTSATGAWAYQGSNGGSNQGNGIAVSGTSVYVTGSFTYGQSTPPAPAFVVAGVSLAPAYTGNSVFVAKYTDNGSSATGIWAVSARGVSSSQTQSSFGNAIAVNGSSVYVTGDFVGHMVIDGIQLTNVPSGNVSGADVFLAKYEDNGTTATAVSAVAGGDGYTDTSKGIAVDGTSVYITGQVAYNAYAHPPYGNSATLGGMEPPTPGVGGYNQMFVARYTDNGAGFTGNWVRTSNSYASPGNSTASAGAKSHAITVSNGDVYVIGNYTGTTARIGTTNLPSTGANGYDDVFVAKYTASGSVSWVSTAGENIPPPNVSVNGDRGTGIAVSGSSVFVGCYMERNATFRTTPVTLTPNVTGVLGQLTTSNGSWERAEFPLSGGRSIARATATDAAGNVFVTGSFTGSAKFGSTVLVAPGSSAYDAFVAKWSPSTNSWVWAVRGGGFGLDVATGIAVRGNSVYVTGSFEGTAASPATIAGTTLISAGGTDAFVAKWTDNGSSATANWAISGGGTGADAGTGIAASGSTVYVSGTFASGTGASMAGTPLAGAGGTDAFVAKYTDNGGSASGGWAVAGGGTGADAGAGVAVSGTNVYLTGSFTSGTSAAFAGTPLAGAGNLDLFVAKYTDNGSSASGGWAVAGGGSNPDAATSIAASGSSVYVAGQVWASSNTSIAGITMPNANGQQMFVAKYIDNGSTSSGTWLKTGGGTDDDGALAVAVSGTSVYVTGRFSSNTGATFAGTALAGSSSPYNFENFSDDVFLARYVDAGNSATDGGAVSGGGPGMDAGRGVAVGGNYVYVAGEVMPSSTAAATFGSSSLTNPIGIEINFLGQVRVSVPPTITSFSPASGPVGTSVTVTGTGFTGATGVSFNGTAATGFTVDSDTQISVSVPSGATTGPIAVTAPGGTAVSSGNYTVQPNPVVYSLTPASGPVGTQVVIAGDNFTGALFVSFNQTFVSAQNFTVNSPTQITVTVPAGATTGPVGVNTGGTTAFSPTPFTVTAALASLTVSSAQNISGSYQNVTITGTGTATLTGQLKVAGTLSVQTGGTLLTGCQPLRGAGSFELQAGATLGICDAAGIRASSADTTGAIRLTGSRSFSPDASYVYNGTQAQATGSGLPAQVRSLELRNAAGLTLSQPLAVAQLLTLTTGDLRTNNQLFTLLSSASGTALVVNTSGVVNGTATVQRYLSPARNAGPGYRHLSTPVSGSTIADLATGSFTPVVNPAYNSSATPNLVTPFPTVFGYDQPRQATSPATTYSSFDKGWFSPTALANPLLVGRGYTVNLAGGLTPDFVGQLINGDQQMSLTRAAGTTAGWHLVGNPYPAPLDWSRVAAADRINLEAAMYVYASTGPYAGSYRSYINGMGGNPIVPLGQGFFVRVDNSASSGTLTFRNAQRLTTPDTTTLRRNTADVRPQVQLALQGVGSADAAYVYFEAGATTGVDAEYDARKLPNTTGLNLAALAGTEPLSIAGLPALTAATVVPLQVAVPAAGSYTLRAEQLLNFTSGTQVLLRDALTGQDIDLQQQASYSFSHSSSSTSRFSLVFRPGSVTASAGARPADQLRVYPNPTTNAFTLQLTAATAGQSAEAVLYNALGQAVRHQAMTAGAAGLRGEFSMAQLPAGVYTLHLTLTDGTYLTKRIVKQ